MSLGGKEEMIFSKSSEVLKTALRAASVVMLRVWRRGEDAAVVSRGALRFCLPREISTLVGKSIVLQMLTERLLSMLLQPTSAKRVIRCVDERVRGKNGYECAVACSDGSLSVR